MGIGGVLVTLLFLFGVVGFLGSVVGGLVSGLQFPFSGTLLDVIVPLSLTVPHLYAKFIAGTTESKEYQSDLRDADTGELAMPTCPHCEKKAEPAEWFKEVDSSGPSELELSRIYKKNRGESKRERHLVVCPNCDKVIGGVQSEAAWYIGGT